MRGVVTARTSPPIGLTLTKPGTDRLEDVCYQRAVEHDATALIFLLKSRCPERYRPPAAKTILIHGPELVRDAEEVRRYRGMSNEELEAELVEHRSMKAAANRARD